MNLQEFASMAARLTPVLSEAGHRILSDNNVADGDDIAQDTLLRLWSIRNKLGDVRSIDALALTIARRLAIDYNRRAAFTPESISACSDMEDHSETDYLIDQIDEKIRSSMILSSLPPRQALVLSMRHIDGLDNNEIAEATGISENNVRVLISRARNNARRFILEHKELL